MKPYKTPQDVFFNFDAIPLWIKPDLWDEEKPMRWRGFYFVFLYIVSVLAFAVFIFVPIGFYKGLSEIRATIAIWLVLSFFGGILIGIFSWREFIIRSRKISAGLSMPKEGNELSDV